MARGRGVSSAKLDEAAVAEIVAGYRASTAWGERGRFFNAMAAKHGVSRRAVEYAAHGDTWKHATGEARL